MGGGGSEGGGGRGRGRKWHIGGGQRGDDGRYG